jgi:hypothetical protein
MRKEHHTMSTLTPAEMEARYDAERSGQLYTKPAVVCPACSCENGPAHHFCDQCGAQLEEETPLSPVEEKAIDILLKRQPNDGSDRAIINWILDQAQNEQAVATWIDDQAEDTDTIAAILEECDGGENEPAGKRFCDAIDAMFDLPEALRLRAVVMLEGFLAGGTPDERFDRVVDNLSDLPDARRAAGLSLVEGFLAGVAIGNAIQ